MDELLASLDLPPWSLSVAAGLGALLVMAILVKLLGKGPGRSGRADSPAALAAQNEAAAQRALAAGNIEGALELFLRAQRPERAASLAERLGRTAQAAELYEKAGSNERALVLYRQLGQGGKVRELEQQLAANAAAAQRAAGSAGAAAGGERGSTQSSAAPASGGFMLPADRARAAQLRFEEARHRAAPDDSAAKAQVEELARVAVDAYLALGDIRKAADLSRDAGLIDQAINLYVNLLGDPGSAATLLAARGEHKRAAELFEQAGENERALSAWIEWSQKADDPLAHAEQVSRLFDKALSRLIDAVVDRRPLASDSIDLYYRMATALEEHDQAADALPLFERIQSVEPRYRDVAQRVEHLVTVVHVGGGGAPRLPAASAKGGDSAIEAQATSEAADGGSAARAASQLDRDELQRLVDEVAQSTAQRVVTMAMGSGQSVRLPPGSAPLPELGIEPPPRVRRVVVARGLEASELHLRYAMDALVQDAKAGPSVEQLQAIVAGRQADLGNIEVFFRLGLAHQAAGRWEQAKAAFEQVEEVSPGYRDAGKRLDELERWRGSVVAAPAAKGTQLSGRYRIAGELGRGGMAVVYRARDEALGRDVALKFLAEGAGPANVMFELFQREARAVASLNHPNIVTVYDTGILDGRAFLCMELVEGTTVEGLLEREGRLQVLDALRITEQVLAALDYAHGRKIIHRDVKPANMMRMGSGQVKLMDFGLAKSVEGPLKTTVVAGTPIYMPPEQLTGKNVDHRSDLFALGASLFEMLTGQVPFDGMRRDTPAPPPSEHNPAVPALLDRLVAHALELDQRQRVASAAEMLGPVREVLQAVAQFSAENDAKGTRVSRPSRADRPSFELATPPPPKATKAPAAGRQEAGTIGHAATLLGAPPSKPSPGGYSSRPAAPAREVLGRPISIRVAQPSAPERGGPTQRGHQPPPPPPPSKKPNR